jgi:hypothetical protein
MFLGHFAVALAAKQPAPRISLGATFLACQFADLLLPVLVILGIERVGIDHAATAFTPLDLQYYPWSHSLGMSLVWSLAAFLLLKAFRFSNGEAALLGGVVFSHWVLDVLTHRPDVPLWFGDDSKLGLGLWNSIPGTLLVESLLFVAGVTLYVRRTRPLNRKGAWGFWGLFMFLAVVYAGIAFGPKPPASATPLQIALPGLALWLVVAWAFSVDRNRSAV